MSKADQNSRRIAQYFFGDMEAKESTSFEQDLLNDAELAKEFEFQSSALEILKSKTVLEDLRSSPDLTEADKIYSEYLSENEEMNSNESLGSGPNSKSFRRKRKLSRFIYPILTAAAVLTGVLVIRNIADDNLNERMYAKYYHPLDVVNFTVRGESIDMYSEFREAVRYYHAGDYLKSTFILSDVTLQNPGFAESAMFLGLSKMGEEDFDSAAHIFEDYLDMFMKYEPEVKWYLAMCYLKLDRSQEAKTLVSELTNLGGDFGKDARQIERRIKGIGDK